MSEIELKRNAGQAVIVVFESREILNAFYASQNLSIIMPKVHQMTEELNRQEKETMVKQAGSPGQLTLITRAFGRGTDFVCLDQEVLSKGGIHVIQTFLSEQVSEETQIKGRTARQGKPGSYGMILWDKALEKFLIMMPDIEAMRKSKDGPYDKLNEKRNTYFAHQYEGNHQAIEDAKKSHAKAKAFLGHLYAVRRSASDKERIKPLQALKDFLCERNKGAPPAVQSRTICLMDATVSMSHLLRAAKTTVGTMFSRVSEILKINNKPVDTFALQFAVYRNYCCQQGMILQASPWETRPENLKTFMDPIGPAGGLGNEAIEIGFWHVNREIEKGAVTQVILIGDAPPNTPQEVIQRRQTCCGEAYWGRTKFGAATHAEKELASIKAHKIPVFAFFVAPRAKKSFEAIAQQTGGRATFLDVNSSGGANELTNAVSEAVLKDSGGEVLVQSYRAKYSSKGYV